MLLRISRLTLVTCLILALSCTSMGVYGVTIDWVTIGNAGNTGDTRTYANGLGTRTYGAVNYEYRIAAYEVTVGEYCEFLNAAATTDLFGLYSPSIATNLNVAGITRSGTSGAYSYSVIGASGNKPVTYVGWFDAARFANWINNGQGSSSTAFGAYSIATASVVSARSVSGGVRYTTSQPMNVAVGDYVQVDGLAGSGFNRAGPVKAVISPTQFEMFGTVSGSATGVGIAQASSTAKSASANVWLPSEDEWHKAAYFDPTLNGGSGGYYAYATQSNTSPGNIVGLAANSANYLNGVYATTQSAVRLDSENYLTAVGAYSNSKSFFGTYDQSGGAFEWTSGAGAVMRGGSWASTDVASTATRVEFDAVLGLDSSPGSGFRLAAVPVPEPSTFVLALVGLGIGGWAMRRRKSRVVGKAA